MPSQRSILYSINIKRKQLDESYKDFGSIDYICAGKTANILMLNINDINERGKGYGYGLLLLCLCNIIKLFPDAYNLTKIHLDDDSDGAMTTNSIYYKLGFRVFNRENSEIMKINFLKPRLSKYMKSKLHIYTREGQTEAEEVYHKTIVDLYQNIITKDKFKTIVKNMVQEVENEELKFNILINGINNDLDISQCLNIDDIKDINTPVLRKRLRSRSR